MAFPEYASSELRPLGVPSHRAGGFSRALESLIAPALRQADRLGMAVLAFAAISPVIAGSFQAGGKQTTIWTSRVGVLLPFEIGAILFLALWLVRQVAAPSPGSAFDRPLRLAAVTVAFGQLFALVWNLSDVRLFAFDIEHLLVPFLAYFLVTRSVKNPRQLKILLFAIAAGICLRAAYLVMAYGVTGSTEFGTATGRMALLISDDTILLLIPVLLAWAALIEKRTQGLLALGAMALVGSVLVVNLLSLRRGALVLICAALAIRAVTIPPRLLMRGALVTALVVSVILVGPARSLLPDIGYTARSVVFQTKDKSTKQRKAEFQNLADNMSGTDWITGRGIGTIWRVKVQTPTDIASYGSGETAYTRIGWHVFGLDWFYKFGLVGVALIVYFGGRAWDLLRRGYRRADPASRSLMWSLGLCLPIFSLFLWGNLRLAMFTGLTLGLLSRLCDFSAANPRT
jgi:hypothetical protein